MHITLSMCVFAFKMSFDLTNTHKIVEGTICHQLAMNRLSIELGMSLVVLQNLGMVMMEGGSDGQISISSIENKFTLIKGEPM